MSIKRLYFDVDRLDKLIVYVSKKPTGTIHILIGTNSPTDVLGTVLARLTATNRSLARWVVKKIEAGELEVKARERVELPEGVELTDDTQGA